MPVSHSHDRQEMRRLASNHHCIFLPAKLLSHRFRRLWLGGDQERPDECEYQRQRPEQGASPYSKFLEAPRLAADGFAPKAFPQATNPGFRKHVRSEDEL